MVDKFKNRSNAPKGYRASVLDKKAPAPRVDREAGVLRGISAMSRGEALGHREWVDAETLKQVADFGNGNPKVKARFTHPGLSSDGADTLLARPKNFRVEGDRVLSDLHILDSAKEEHVERVMTVAEESPELAGFSIVAPQDWDAMDQFTKDNSVVEGDERVFVSPDPLNIKQFPHLRILSLKAVDYVDSPAANESGMFSDENVDLVDLRKTLLFGLGISEENPNKNFAGYNPERIRRFGAEILAREGYEVVPVGKIQERREKVMPDPEVTKDAALSEGSPPVDSRDAEFAEREADLQKREAALAKGERAQSIRQYAAEAGMEEMADELIESNKSVEDCKFSLLVALGQDSTGKGENPADSLSESDAVGANEPAELEFSEPPKPEREFANTPTHEEVVAFQEAHPEYTDYAEAAVAASKEG